MVLASYLLLFKASHTLVIIDIVSENKINE